MEKKTSRQNKANWPKEEIITIRSKDKFVYIKPAYVHKGDIVIWKAVDSDITLFFPDPDLFGETLGTISKGKYKALPVLLNPGRKKEEIFYYSVYHHGIKDFGEGNSSPAIIIKK